jgi:type II secretion system protein I
MRPGPDHARGFTLIEVMLSMAVVAIALVALLGLQHQTLQSIIRANQLTTAAMLAQELVTEAELQVFPPLGDTKGDFQSTHRGQYVNYRWERDVEASAVFPDIRTVHVRVYFGNRFGRRFDLTELVRNPLPIQGP